MGTDRVEEYRGPCACGVGEYIVNFCTPDHPYPTQSKWWECNITCPTCADRYELRVGGGHLAQILKADVEKREAHKKRIYEAEEDVMNTAAPHLSKFASRLSQEPSVAAVYRTLSTSGVIYLPTDQTFRKHWKSAGGAEGWIKFNVGIHNLSAVMDYLGVTDESVEAGFATVDDLRKATPPLPLKRIAQVQAPF